MSKASLIEALPIGTVTVCPNPVHMPPCALGVLICSLQCAAAMLELLHHASSAPLIHKPRPLLHEMLHVISSEIPAKVTIVDTSGVSSFADASARSARRSAAARSACRATFYS